MSTAQYLKSHLHLSQDPSSPALPTAYTLSRKTYYKQTPRPRFPEDRLRKGLLIQEGGIQSITTAFTDHKKHTYNQAPPGTLSQRI